MKQRLFGLVAVFLTLILCVSSFADTIDLSSQGYNHNVVAGASYVTVISFDYNTGGNNTTVNFRRLKDDGGDSWMMPVSFTSTYIEVDSDYGPYRYNASLSGTHNYVFTLNRFNGLWTLAIDGTVVDFVATSSTTTPQPDGVAVTAGAVVANKYFSDETPESGQNVADLGWPDAVSGIGSAGAYKVKFPADSGSYIQNLMVTPMSGMVMYYDFDSVGATVADGSGNGNDATVVGNVTGNVFGRSGAGLVFGGTVADILDVTATAVADRPTTAVTIAAWCKIANLGGGQMSVFNTFGPKPSDPGSNAYLYHMEIRPSNNDYRWCVRNAEGETIGNLLAPATMTFDKWFHFACTYDKNATDGLNLKVFINGNQIGTLAAGAVSDLNLGANWDHGAAIGATADGARPFDGQMDEFYMFNRALTPAEISTLASTSWLKNGGFETGDLTGWTEWSDGTACIVDINSARDVEIAPGMVETLEAYQGDYSCYLVDGYQSGITQTLAIPAGTLVQVDAQWAGTFIVGGQGWAEIKALTHTPGASYNLNETPAGYTGDVYMVAKTDTYGPLNPKANQTWDWEDAPADSPIDGNQFVSRGEVVLATKLGGFSAGRGMALDNVAVTPLYSLTTAYEPQPADGSSVITDTNTITVEFSWIPGYAATSHDVYLGTDFDDVNNATNASAEFMGNQIANTYSPTLLSGMTYFWRIDETDGVDTWKGAVWSLEVKKMPAPKLFWEMDSAEDFTLGGADGSISGRLYVTNNASGYKYAGMTATGGIQYDADEGAVRMDGVHPCRIYGMAGNAVGENPNLIFTSKTQYTFSLFAKGDKSTVAGWGYSFYLFWDDNSKFKCDLSWLPTASASFTSPGGGWQSSAYHIWDTDPAYADRYVDPETWNMYTFVWDVDNQSIATYVNGIVRGGPMTSGTAITPGAAVTDFGFGDGYGWHGPGGWYKDYRIYDTALNKDQIQFILGDFLLYPKNPSPKNGLADVALDGTVLTWKHGIDTVYQDVYFGTNEIAVKNVDTSSAAYKGQIALENTYDPGSLELMKTYYWRVDQLDENSDLIVKGPVWSFNTLESIMVEDFESYDEEGNDVTAVWVDALDYSDMQRLLATEPGYPVLSPVNSLRLRYHALMWSPAPYYTIAGRTFSPAQDWTANGVKVLTIHYYGDAGNQGLPMFVTIGDGTTDANVVVDVNTLAESWNQINVSLPEIAAAGVDLTKVSYMEIGFGDGTDQGMSSGQYDIIYIDDIALYPPKCVLSESSLTADITQDCVVNYDDLAYITEGWLRGSSADAIAAAGPVGLWLFDDSANLLKATIGNNLTTGTYNGTGGPVTAAGIAAGDGAAMVPLNTYLKMTNTITPAPGQTRTNEYTMVWDVKIPAASAYGPMRWVGLGEFDTADLTTDVDISVIYRRSSIDYVDGLFGTHQGWSAPLVTPDKWCQLAVSVKNGEFFRCYVNGEFAVETASQAVDGRYSIGNAFHIFKDNDNEDPDINCSTFALFDRALTAAEIRSLVPIQLVKGDINADTAIDFADYSILANEWLIEDLWP